MRISLSAARVNAGLTLRDVHKITGIGADTLSKYEKGSTMPKWDVFCQLCELYNCSVSDIFLPTR